MFQMSVIPGAVVENILKSKKANLVQTVERAYIDHANGININPESVFLRFSHQPASRIIALPAHLGSSPPVSGIKWISSFPSNLEHGLPRASAVIILNDSITGYPYAVLEGGLISAARTAASAVAALRRLHRSCAGRMALGVVGAGIISRNVIECIIANGGEIDTLIVNDVSTAAGQRFSDFFAERHHDMKVEIGEQETIFDSCDVILLATTAVSPHIDASATFRKNPTILHLSLRDLPPGVILRGQNFVDDIEHSLRANTSLQLTAKIQGNSDFIAGTIADLISDHVEVNFDIPRIFSPFGLGILDIAIAREIYATAYADGLCMTIEDFFARGAQW